jgi:hypothetical protein
MARKELTTIFESFGLIITAQTNIKCVNFLDLTLDLSNGKYKPYRKPNDEPLYLTSHHNFHTQSTNALTNYHVTKKHSTQQPFTTTLFTTTHFTTTHFTTTLSNKAPTEVEWLSRVSFVKSIDRQ